jgi:lycopene cyclase-like protein
VRPGHLTRGRADAGSACRAALPPPPAGALRPPRAALALPPRRAAGVAAAPRACRAARRRAVAALPPRAAAADGAESSVGDSATSAAPASAPRASRHATWEGIPPPPLALDIKLPALSRGGADAPYDLVVRMWRRSCCLVSERLHFFCGVGARIKAACAFHVRLTRARPRRRRAAAAARSQVVGCGPAGLCAAERTAAKGLKGTLRPRSHTLTGLQSDPVPFLSRAVALVDPSPCAPWRNNYGVWVDEFEALGHGDCFTRSWPLARVLLTEDAPAGLSLDRAYAQVDRAKLKAKLLTAAVASGVEFFAGKVEGVAHPDDDAEGAAPSAAAAAAASASALSVVTLRGGGAALHARAVLDATGHARRLVRFDTGFTPGYQAAYGILAEVEAHPFPLDEMLFMDWRYVKSGRKSGRDAPGTHHHVRCTSLTCAFSPHPRSDEHLDADSKERNRSLPTFLYVMPFSPTRVFMEETSLVARPGVDFDDIKLRMKQRLAHLGVRVTAVLEEEHCLIPMGGVLPALPQRTLGIGGTGGMVHPSTGFMLSKTLNAGAVVADTLAAELAAGKAGKALSDAVWEAVWPQQQRRMRTFMCFGMETLMQLDIGGTRRFFGTFFGLPRELWSGFLSWRVRPVGLIGLGLSLFSGFSPRMRLEFILSALPFIPSFAANFLAPGVPGNRFDSAPWGGLRLPALRRPEAAAAASAPVIAAARGRLALLPPNPTVVPILASGTDFAALVGLPPALAGGLDAETRAGEAPPPTDYASLLAPGLDLDTPQPASASRDDRDWNAFQQRKEQPEQPLLATLLPPLRDGDTVDVAVVGAGPAGLAIAAELASRGLSVGIIAPDTPFVNNYGVWVDELTGPLADIAGALSNLYSDALYWVDEASPNEGIPVNRAYGRVDRAKLRQLLAAKCASGGVRFLADLVSEVDNADAATSRLRTEGGARITAALTVCASGHARELVAYEPGKPPGWQTAYGIEVRMQDHPFPLDKVAFMDLRQSDAEPDGDASGLWRVPSFLYVMPTDKDTVFLEETCLMSRVQVPFDELKRRLLRRMARMGLPPLDGVLEEEASWIPLGGGLPLASQRNVAFGAAAGLVHPGSGFSVVNSLSLAPAVADAIAASLRAGAPPADAAAAAWGVLWSPERRRRMGFYQFGMELVLSLRVADLRGFFSTFYSLPEQLSTGFLSHRLSAASLLLFAFMFFIIGDNRLRWLLVSHLVSPAGSGARLATAYLNADADAAAAATAGAADVAAVRRTAPPQTPAPAVSAEEQARNEAAGVPAGFQGADWWVVGAPQKGR